MIVIKITRCCHCY